VDQVLLVGWFGSGSLVLHARFAMVM